MQGCPQSTNWFTRLLAMGTCLQYPPHESGGCGHTPPESGANYRFSAVFGGRTVLQVDGLTKLPGVGTLGLLSAENRAYLRCAATATPAFRNFPCQLKCLPVKFKYPHCQSPMRVFAFLMPILLINPWRLISKRRSPGVSGSLAIRQPSVAGRAAQRWQ